MTKRTPFPVGSIIQYMDVEATVLQDTGDRTIYIDIDGEQETWQYELDGVKCKLVRDNAS
jgi:hypothetical protein